MLGAAGDSVPGPWRLSPCGDSHGLSAREREVLAKLLCGQDIQGIATELVVSQSTVKTHLHRIYTKVGVSSKDELIREFWRW